MVDSTACQAAKEKNANHHHKGDRRMHFSRRLWLLRGQIVGLSGARRRNRQICGLSEHPNFALSPVSRPVSRHTNRFPRSPAVWRNLFLQPRAAASVEKMRLQVACLSVHAPCRESAHTAAKSGCPVQ